MIAPEIEWVVLTGIPNVAIDANMAPPPVSAQNPWYGLSGVNLNAMVLIILQPPKKVPNPMAEAAAIITGKGTTKELE
jgi:hypothetical protein